MKDFTAFYDTEKMKNVGYSFEAKDLDSAIEFCKNKFSVEINKIILDWNEETEKVVYEKPFSNYEITKMKQRIANAFNAKKYTKKTHEQFLLIEKDTKENKKYARLHIQLYK